MCHCIYHNNLRLKSLAGSDNVDLHIIQNLLESDGCLEQQKCLKLYNMRFKMAIKPANLISFLGKKAICL